MILPFNVCIYKHYCTECQSQKNFTCLVHTYSPCRVDPIVYYCIIFFFFSTSMLYFQINLFSFPCALHILDSTFLSFTNGSSSLGHQFEGNLLLAVCQLLQIMKTRTTPYHPSSNGQVECYNRQLLQMIHCFLS